MSATPRLRYAARSVSFVSVSGCFMCPPFVQRGVSCVPPLGHMKQCPPFVPKGGHMKQLISNGFLASANCIRIAHLLSCTPSLHLVVECLPSPFTCLFQTASLITLSICMMRMPSAKCRGVLLISDGLSALRVHPHFIRSAPAFYTQCTRILYAMCIVRMPPARCSGVALKDAHTNSAFSRSLPLTCARSFVFALAPCCWSCSP